jgi:hypothetical protein
MSDIRDKQVGGDHYKKNKIQPWDIIDDHNLNFYEGNALKYLLRRKGKREEDLQKAIHYLEKEVLRNKIYGKKDTNTTTVVRDAHVSALDGFNTSKVRLNEESEPKGSKNCTCREGEPVSGPDGGE